MTCQGREQVDIKGLVSAIKEGKPINRFFTQIEDSRFAVTGGYLGSIHDTLYLVGGQKFQGRYNPIGPDHGPGFTQEYTDQIKKFTISHINGSNLKIEYYNSVTDTAILHRRDYNMVPQIAGNGNQSLVAFSGVFQKWDDIPYLNAVKITSSGHEEIQDFKQYFNHYHCAVAPIYSAENDEMNTLFFGGIARYYLDEQNNRIDDKDVPFVKTIAVVNRNSKNEMKEFVLEEIMPGYMGSGAEFFVNPDISSFENGIINYDSLPNDSTLIGYIYGGIESSADNIFFINNGTQSNASSNIYKVILIKSKTPVYVDASKVENKNNTLSIFPNPAKNVVNVSFELEKAQELTIHIYEMNGQRILQENFSKEQTTPGLNRFQFNLEGKSSCHKLIIRAESAEFSQSKAIIWQGTGGHRNGKGR